MSGHTASALAIGMAVLIALSGCAGFMPGDGGDGTGAETAMVSLFLSDQPNAIDDFQHLNVTVTQVGFKQAENDTWVNRSVDEATLDLTQLQGENAALLGNLTIPAGQYSKVFIHVSAVNGTLQDGSSVDVKLPSSTLQLSKNFAVDPDEELSFVYDVGVHQTGQGKYIIKPNVGESGPNKPVKRVDGKAKAKQNGGKQNGKQTTTTTTTSTTAGGGNGQGQQGSMAMYLSDQPNAIGDFQSLTVTISLVAVHPKKTSGNQSWLEFDAGNRTFDLTRLQGDNASLLGNLSIPAGEYTKVFIHVSTVNGTLQDGSSTDVKLPSSKLQLSKPFTISANQTTTFVYDVGVHQTGGGKYSIKPQVGESGPDKPIKPVNATVGAGGQSGSQTTATTTATTTTATTTTATTTTATTTSTTTTTTTTNTTTTASS